MHSNEFLNSLDKTAVETLRPHLRAINLHQKQLLFDVGDTITMVVFPTTSIASLIVPLSTGETLEIAMVGKDGGVGVGTALDGQRCVSRAIVQHAGSAFVCDARLFKQIVMTSEPLMRLMFQHEQKLFAQTQQSAACVASHMVEARLARWLLRARDLSGSNEFNFTQEYLAEMLAVRRTSVSPVANHFQSKGLIDYSRGRIVILNVDGLKAIACECYHTIQHLQDDPETTPSHRR
jgi:CRP-like cAMP-binding protein